jgi:hypothetical protein
LGGKGRPERKAEPFAVVSYPSVTCHKTNGIMRGRTVFVFTKYIYFDLIRAYVRHVARMRELRLLYRMLGRSAKV